MIGNGRLHLDRKLELDARSNWKSYKSSRAALSLNRAVLHMHARWLLRVR